MEDWYSKSGKPLASNEWLIAHHEAKLSERKSFAEKIAGKKPQRIVDLGCGPGLWLSVLAEKLPATCELYGIDSDANAILYAEVLSKSWQQSVKLQHMDIEKNAHNLPEADIFLAFNIFPYFKNINEFLSTIMSKIRPGGYLIIRQYDGGLLRIGPMDDNDRKIIDTSLMTAVKHSQQFKHYDLDRVYEAIFSSAFLVKQVDYEVFSRTSPYPKSFYEYFHNTISWTKEYISDEAKIKLQKWEDEYGITTQATKSSYFIEVDLVAWLS